MCRNILSLMLVVVMLCAALSSCGKKNNIKETVPPTESVVSETKDPEETQRILPEIEPRKNEDNADVEPSIDSSFDEEKIATESSEEDTSVMPTDVATPTAAPPVATPPVATPPVETTPAETLSPETEAPETELPSTDSDVDDDVPLDPDQGEII